MTDNIYDENTVSNGLPVHGGGFKKPTLAQAGILYSIAVLFLLFIGSKVQRREFYSGILITEFILIALPAVLLLIIYRYDIKKVLRLNNPGALNMFLVFLIMSFAIPLVGVLNLVNYLLIKSIFGKIAIEQPPVATDLPGLVISILVIGGSAGICEEILFRGTLQRAFERFGTVKAILITAFLFGLMHVDFQKLFGTFLLGALIGFIVYRTNSLFAGMFAHFTNNSLAVVISYGVAKFNEVLKASGKAGTNQPKTPDLDFSALLNMPKGQLVAAIVFYVFIIAVCAVIFTGLMIGFIKSTSKRALTSDVQGETAMESKARFLWFLPGLLAVSVIYYAQGLKLLGVKLEILDSIFRALGLK